MSKTLIWWEKTVEYLFILEYTTLNTFAAPFDGTIEALGDAIFSNKDSWVLIEFKRSVKELDSEKEKYINYEELERQLSILDYFHFLIYGENVNGNLDIKAKTYFSRTEEDTSKVLSSGCPDPKLFNAYLKKIYEAKKSGGSLGESDFAVVAGVNRSGQITQTLSVANYLRAVNAHELAKKLELEQQARTQAIKNTGTRRKR